MPHSALVRGHRTSRCAHPGGTCMATHWTSRRDTGLGSSGQLGGGSLNSSTAATAVDNATVSAWLSLTAGLNYVCGIELISRGAFCWGFGQWGVLGAGNTQNTSKPQAVGTDANYAWHSLSAGQSHMCGISFDGSAAFCWGECSNNMCPRGAWTLLLCGAVSKAWHGMPCAQAPARTASWELERRKGSSPHRCK